MKALSILSASPAGNRGHAWLCRRWSPGMDFSRGTAGSLELFVCEHTCAGRDAQRQLIAYIRFKKCSY